MRILITVTALILALIVTASTMTGFILFVPALLVIPDTITGWRIQWHLRKLMNDGR